MYRNRHIFVFLFLPALLWLVASPSGVCSKAPIDVRVTLDRDTIGLDEQATLQIIIAGSEQNLPRPDLPRLPTFEVYSQGRSSNISISGGKVEASVTYRYLLFPKKAGVFPIDQISVVFGNQRYKGNRVEVTVLNKGVAASPKLEGNATRDDGKTRDYFFEASIDKTNPFVNEQVTLSLKFFIAVQNYGTPELTEPSLTGFWHEVLGNKAPFYQKIRGRTYKVIERKYALFPTQTGDLTIGRSIIKTSVASRNRTRRSVFDDFFGRGVEVSASSKPIRLKVRPLPTKGRPDNFTGTIGKFSIQAQADKSEVEVNQPVTVTIRISGTGNIKPVAEPIIPEMEEFRVYRASSSENISKSQDVIGGTKLFEEVFVPRKPGDLVIPALSFNYFDPATEKYHVLTTRPIKVRVTRPEGYVDSPDVPYASPELTIGSHARDIRYIKSEVGDLTPIGQPLILTPTFIAVNSAPVILLAGMFMMRLRRDKLAGDVGLARSRGASRAARKRLAQAQKLAAIETGEEFFLEVSSSVTSFIADKLNISPHGLTSEKMTELLVERKGDDQLLTDLTTLLERCDYARFAPSSMSIDDITTALTSAEEIMTKMEGVKFD